MLFVGGGVDGGGQADVTHNVLGVWEARDRAQDEDGGQGGQGADPRMREQPSGARVRVDDTRDLLVELVDAAGAPVR